MHEGHRQRMKEQLKTSGMDSLSDVQVLEVLLFYAIGRVDTNPIAHRLMQRFGSLSGVLEAPKAELLRVEGMGEHAAELIGLVAQIERRHLIDRASGRKVLDSTAKCGQYLVPFFHGEKEEVVYLLCLDAKCAVLDCVPVHRGGINVANISVRKIVKAALDVGATTVVLAHNHPAGVALPSPEDLSTTQIVRSALSAVGVMLADHVIVADDDYVSLGESGALL